MEFINSNAEELPASASVHSRVPTQRNNSKNALCFAAANVILARDKNEPCVFQRQQTL